MELTGNFLQQFKVPQTKRLSCFQSTKRDSLLVVGMFDRETFPAPHYRWKNLEVQCNNHQYVQHLPLSKNESSKLPELSFDRLQPTDQECTGLQKRNFGRFVARESILDEEYWTAAWLRAEAHWESLSYMRHVDSYKRKYAEQEFYALKRRCVSQEGNSLKCSCFVAIKKEDKNVRRTVLSSIVGTLDLSIRQFVQGETFPGVQFYVSELLYIAKIIITCVPRKISLIWTMLLASYHFTAGRALCGIRYFIPETVIFPKIVSCSVINFQRQLTMPKSAFIFQERKRLSVVLASQEPFDAHKYAYIANVCVAKFARRQGIASNMLYLATDAATMAGMKQLIVHVNADNKPAQELYRKTGFKVVEAASSPMSKDQRILMSMEL